MAEVSTSRYASASAAGISALNQSSSTNPDVGDVHAVES